MTRILLVDCNNFFVSCEELFNPSLKGKAVCVLSNNDGCIVSRSNKAKDMGIPMGMPYFMAKRKFKNVEYISGNISKYSEISKRIMQKLSDYTPSVEIYSIDEAFLDIEGTQKLHKMTPGELADKIRKDIKEQIGIEVSIGVSKTKTLSKIASEIAKNNTRKNISSEYEGVFEINENNIDEILFSMPVEEIWGVGKNLHKFFRKHNIISAKDYINSDDDFIKRNLGKKGVELKEELKGIIKYPVSQNNEPPKSISKSASFREFTTDEDFIKNSLNYHLHRICIKLRKYNLGACSMSVMLRTKDFRVIKEKISFKTPKISEFELYKTMHELFEKIYDKNIIYRSSGVCVYNLSSIDDVQLMLFESETIKKKRKLSDAWDKIEQKFGYGILNIGMKK